METQPEAVVLSDRRKLPQTLLIISGVIILIVGSIGIIYALQWNNTKNSNLIFEAKLAQIIADAQSQEFVFTAVPKALELVTLPIPPDSNETDAIVYNQLKSDPSVSIEIVQNDVVFNLPFMGATYGEYLNTIENPDEIFQVTDELHQLAVQLNTTFNRLPLKDRIAGVLQMAPLDAISVDSDVRSVYPSIRAINAYLGAEIMSRIDPENKDSYRQEAEALINRGIGYGLYGQSDADAAKSVVTQYLALYNPDSQ